MADRTKDFVKNRLSFLAFWVLPATAMIATVSSEMERETVGSVWVVALLTMSVGCFFNAFRSGRLHCVLTGPFFLLMALATLLFRLEILPLGARGWEWIGAVTMLGAVALTYLPERIWGQYLKR